MAARAGKCKQVLVSAIFAFYAGEAIVQISVIEIAVDDLLNIGTEKSILLFKLS